MKRAAQALVLLALLANACKSGKPITLLHRDVPARSADKILERVLAAQVEQGPYYSAKANVELKFGEEQRSFKAQVRSVRDSALWVSVVPALGIEAARLLVTNDSVKFIDKLHSQYFVGDTAMAQKRFHMQPRFSLLQEALLGLPIGLDPQGRYRNDREDGHYVLTSREKRRFIRAAEDMSPGDTLARDRDMGDRRMERTLRKAEEREAVVYRYWIEPDSFRVSRIQIVDLVHDQTADVRYEERGDAEHPHLPTRINITLSEPGRMASAVLELTRIEQEGPLQVNFRIPEKYEPMP